jgi:FAD/FMN-containing dehydrogenase
LRSTTPAALARQISEIQVLRDAALGHEAKLLIDDDDPGGERGACLRRFHRLAVEQDGSGIGGFGAAQDLHERALAGAIFADDSQNFAAFKIERDVVECADRPIRLADAAHLKERFAHLALLTSSPQSPYALACALSTFAFVSSR